MPNNPAPTATHTCQLPTCRKIFTRKVSAGTGSALLYCSRACYLKHAHGLTPASAEARKKAIYKAFLAGDRPDDIAARHGVSRQRATKIFETVAAS